MQLEECPVNDPKVNITTYRVGLGDCHLLTFTLSNNKKRHILIDCGYFPGSGFPGIGMDTIMDDLVKRTGNSLDALVVTHEHQDHLQGFMDAEPRFRAMTKSELWLAWTEQPGQKTLPEKRRLAGLEAGAAALAFTGTKEAKSTAAGIENILGFSAGTDLAFETVKNWFPEGSRKYWSPGKVIEPDWLPGVRIYVLGPPKDLKMLHKKTGKKDVEMYELSAQQWSFAAAAMDEAEPGTLSPFYASYARQELPDDLAGFYNKEPWRRIDNDWLFTAARMALQVDTYTNNTSLVLAFELIHSKRVLLFVGDAQIGNWLSWLSPEKPLKFKVNNETVTGHQLLERTVFYKVGHHGSNNATLVENGLLDMTNPDLHADIPTNESWAKNIKHWEMPNARLLTELKKRCHGPVLRPDRASAGDVAVECTLADDK